jgi:hypothetical protein
MESISKFYLISKFNYQYNKTVSMKKTFLPVCFVCSAMLFFTQCKKDESSIPAASNFSPLTAGSNWTYKYTEGAATSTIVLTATNRDTVANAKTYKVLSSSDGTLSYLAKVGNDYYRFASFPAIGVNSFEELYLKDNKAVNETWTGTASFKYSGTDVTANLTYTVKGKGESRTVNGKVYNNVTHVRLDIAVFANIGGGDFYYQEGVGLIEDSILVTPPLGGQAYSSKQEIISYVIK